MSFIAGFLAVNTVGRFTSTAAVIFGAGWANTETLETLFSAAAGYVCTRFSTLVIEITFFIGVFTIAVDHTFNAFPRSLITYLSGGGTVYSAVVAVGGFFDALERRETYPSGAAMSIVHTFYTFAESKIGLVARAFALSVFRITAFSGGTGNVFAAVNHLASITFLYISAVTADQLK